MSGWNLAFDYSAIFVFFMLLLWCINEKRIPLKTYRVFSIFISLNFVSTILETIAFFMLNKDNVNLRSVNILMSFQTLLFHVILLLFSYYVMNVIDSSAKILSATRVYIYLAVFLLFVATILNIIFECVYVFEPGSVERYPLSYVCVALIGILLLTSFISTIVNRRKLSYIKITMIFVSYAIIATAILLNVFMNAPIVCFGIAMASLALYNYLQNPTIYIDKVTNLYNRDFMAEYLKNRFREEKSFYMIIIAMDDFKYINKTYGVETGDEMLRQVGMYLKTIQGSKFVYRFGSDQFCVQVSSKVLDVKELTDDILERFKHPWYNEIDTGIMMSATICVYECNKEAKSFDEFVEVVDYSLSVAKNTKKGNVSIANDLELGKLKNEKEIEKAVRLAIDRDELMVYYQPIFSVGVNKYNSAEALVRLNDEKLGWISPEIFIPIAEKNGLILTMGMNILRKVCNFIKEKDISHTSIEYIEVNISPIQLQQLNFADEVIKLLEEYDVKPEQINMEITETANMVGSTAIINDNIKQLVEYGIKFSLDDYGSGYSNLDYINNMPFHIIKLDKSIVWDAFKNDKAGITLEYTIGMLNALKYMIVAEGVETQEMTEKLADIGCHYMQGWYYSKAVDEDKFLEVINNISPIA